MQNKRTLKRSINLICDELFAECLAASLYGHNKESAEALIFTIAKMRKDYIARISHPEPGMPLKTYFKKVREEFAAQSSDTLDHINTHL